MGHELFRQWIFGKQDGTKIRQPCSHLWFRIDVTGDLMCECTPGSKKKNEMKEGQYYEDSTSNVIILRFVGGTSCFLEKLDVVGHPRYPHLTIFREGRTVVLDPRLDISRVYEDSVSRVIASQLKVFMA